MHVSIDHRAAVPPGEQLRSQLALLIVGGSLGEGERLPSVRQLAADLKLAPGTVARVYKELEASGHVMTSASGTRVRSLGARAEREKTRAIHAAARRYAETAQRAGIALRDALDVVRLAYENAAGDEAGRGTTNVT